MLTNFYKKTVLFIIDIFKSIIKQVMPWSKIKIDNESVLDFITVKFASQ